MVEAILLEDAIERIDRVDRASHGPRRHALSRRAVVLTTGTFLKALMHIGEAKTRGGRAGDASAEALSDSLTRAASSSPASRPARRAGSTAARSTSPKCEPQPGDAEPAAVQLRHRADRRSRRWIATSPTRTRPCTT